MLTQVINDIYMFEENKFDNIDTQIENLDRQIEAQIRHKGTNIWIIYVNLIVLFFLFYNVFY